MISPSIVLHAGKIAKMFISKEDLDAERKKDMLHEAEQLLKAIPADHESRMAMVKMLAGLVPKEK